MSTTNPLLDIDIITTFLYWNVEFFAAPFTSSDTFQTWSQQYADEMTLLTETMRDVLSPGSFKQTINTPASVNIPELLPEFVQAICGNAFPTPDQDNHCLLMGDKRLIQKLLLENPRLVTMFKKIMRYHPLINEWYQSDGQSFYENRLNKQMQSIAIKNSIKTVSVSELVTLAKQPSTNTTAFDTVGKEFDILALSTYLNSQGTTSIIDAPVILVPLETIDDGILSRTFKSQLRMLLTSLTETHNTRYIKIKALLMECHQYKQHLTEVVRNEFKRDHLTYTRYMLLKIYYLEKRAVEGFNMEGLVEDIDIMKNDKNVSTTLIDALEKYRWANKLSLTLREKTDDSATRLMKFQNLFNECQKQLEKRRDSRTMTFLKVIASILTMGLAMPFLWKVKGKEKTKRICEIIENKANKMRPSH